MPKKFNQTAGNHRRIDHENVDFDDFQAESVIYLLNGSGYLEVPRTKNVCPFVYKPHNICIELSHMVCATTFSMIFIKGDGFCVFDLDYIAAFSPYKTRSQNRLWLRAFEWLFLSIGWPY